MFWYDLFDILEPGPPSWPINSPSAPISDAMAIVACFTFFCDNYWSLAPKFIAVTRLFGSCTSLVSCAAYFSTNFWYRSF